MRRRGNFFATLCDQDYLSRSFDRAARGKLAQRSVVWAIANRDDVLKNLRASLLAGTFRTSPYQTKTVYVPKQRLIHILPFSPDRIVHHALMGLLAPYWDTMFDNGAHACRPGRGQHRASADCMGGVRKCPWVMQADVRKFYPSIPHDRLMAVVCRKIKDVRILALLEDIIYSLPGGRGLPIGNLSSQWLGALYLNELDRHVRQRLKPSVYIRYCDDFLLFYKTKEDARASREACAEYLQESLGLEIAKDRFYPTAHGVDFVGYRHFRGYKLVRKSTARRMRKRIQTVRSMLAKNRFEPAKARCVAASIRGWLAWADTHNLANSIGLTSLEAEIHAELS